MWHIAVGRRHYVRQCYLNYSSKRSDLGSPPVAFLTTTQPCKAVPPWRTRKVVIRMKPRRRAPNRNRDLASGEERGEAPHSSEQLAEGSPLRPATTRRQPAEQREPGGFLVDVTRPSPLSLSLYTFFSHPFLFSRTPVSSLNPLAPRKTGWRRPDNPRGYSSAFRRGRGHYNHHQLWQDGSAFASLSLANLASTQAAPGTTQPLSQSTQSQHN